MDQYEGYLKFRHKTKPAANEDRIVNYYDILYDIPDNDYITSDLEELKIPKESQLKFKSYWDYLNT